jgi:serine/threonine protein phosphatase PrpC
VFFQGSRYRVNGELAVSRSIGDTKYKPSLTAIPEVLQIKLNAGDSFLIMASDGLYEKLSMKYVVDKVNEMV